jgi:hypothetical protein
MTHLISNPPKYELEDGSIQVWRGMPKLPDVVNVMLDLRDKAVQDARKRESQRESRELAELEKRRAEHPEEFIGMKELQEITRKLQIVAKPVRAVHMQSTGKSDKYGLEEMIEVLPDGELADRREMLRQQAEMLKGKS